MKFNITLMLAALAVASFQNVSAMQGPRPHGRKNGNKTSQRNPRRNPRAQGSRGPSTRDQARRQEERDFKRAIHLSLQGQGRNVVRDPQLKKALEISRQEAQNREELRKKKQEDLDRAVALSIREDDRRLDEINERFRGIVITSDMETQELQELIEVGADVNALRASGRTSLHDAVYVGNAEVCKFLLSHGADVHAVDTAGWTPLHWVSRCSQPEICLIFLDAGADIEAKCTGIGHGPFKGYTPLHVAVGRKSPTVCQQLIHMGADVSATCCNGQMPLHHAVAANFPEICHLLLNAGADMLAPDNNYQTSFLKAVGGVHIDACKALFTHVQFWPADDDVKKSYERIKTALLVFNRHSTKIPRGARYLMLSGNSELRSDLGKMFAQRLRNGKMIPQFGKSLAIEYLYGYTLSRLKTLIFDLCNHPAGGNIIHRGTPMESLLDVETLESIFGQGIRSSIEERVFFLMEAAKKNAANQAGENGGE